MVNPPSFLTLCRPQVKPSEWRDSRHERVKLKNVDTSNTVMMWRLRRSSSTSLTSGQHTFSHDFSLFWFIFRKTIQTMSSGGVEPIPNFTKKNNSEVRLFKALGSLWKRAKSTQDLFLPTSCTAKYLSTPPELGDRTIQSWKPIFWTNLLWTP